MKMASSTTGNATGRSSLLRSAVLPLPQTSTSLQQHLLARNLSSSSTSLASSNASGRPPANTSTRYEDSNSNRPSVRPNFAPQRQQQQQQQQQQRQQRQQQQQNPSGIYRPSSPFSSAGVPASNPTGSSVPGSRPTHPAFSKTLAASASQHPRPPSSPLQPEKRIKKEKFTQRGPQLKPELISTTAAYKFEMEGMKEKKLVDPAKSLFVKSYWALKEALETAEANRTVMEQEEMAKRNRVVAVTDEDSGANSKPTTPQKGKNNTNNTNNNDSKDGRTVVKPPLFTDDGILVTSISPLINKNKFGFKNPFWKSQYHGGGGMIGFAAMFPNTFKVFLSHLNQSKSNAGVVTVVDGEEVLTSFEDADRIRTLNLNEGSGQREDPETVFDLWEERGYGTPLAFSEILPFALAPLELPHGFKIVYGRTHEVCDSFIFNLFVERVDDDGNWIPIPNCVVGFDTETTVVMYDKAVRPPSVIQISTRHECLLVHLDAMRSRLPYSVEWLLEHPKILKACLDGKGERRAFSKVAVPGFVRPFSETWRMKMADGYGGDGNFGDRMEEGEEFEEDDSYSEKFTREVTKLKPQGFVDVAIIAQDLGFIRPLSGSFSAPGLSELVACYMGLDMAKPIRIRVGDWTKPLRMDQRAYAATDAWTSLMIYETLVKDERELRKFGWVANADEVDGAGVADVEKEKKSGEKPRRPSVSSVVSQAQNGTEPSPHWARRLAVVWDHRITMTPDEFVKLADKEFRKVGFSRVFKGPLVTWNRDNEGGNVKGFMRMVYEESKVGQADRVSPYLVLNGLLKGNVSFY
ncbi:hypothetical protein HDU76_013673 [Blyttiomyces sp. JEL0837]|nr:hypothetical protein HDU76_013673 [Blyttiomyces sp. JEL0837]